MYSSLLKENILPARGNFPQYKLKMYRYWYLHNQARLKVYVYMMYTGEPPVTTTSHKATHFYSAISFPKYQKFQR